MRDGTLNRPADVVEAQTLVAQLCDLQRAVCDTVYPRYERPADCFCGESGYWPLESPRDFRNDGHAVAFIENVVQFTLRHRWLWRWFA